MHNAKKKKSNASLTVGLTSKSGLKTGCQQDLLTKLLWGTGAVSVRVLPNKAGDSGNFLHGCKQRMLSLWHWCNCLYHWSNFNLLTNMKSCRWGEWRHQYLAQVCTAIVFCEWLSWGVLLCSSLMLWTQLLIYSLRVCGPWNSYFM